MSCVMADLYGVAKENIKPDMSSANVTSGPNIRPRDVQLDTSYSFQLIDFKTVMQFKDSIKDCLENFVY